MAKHPDAAKQAWWLDLIRRWQRSQFSVREFCQRHQVSEASFFSWRRVLRERGLLDETSPAKASSDGASFVKLIPLGSEPSPIEVVLNPQRMLRIRPGFDAETLLQLVRLLEEPAC